MVTKAWLERYPDLATKIDKSVFPWLQWWPHNHQILSVAVALWEALKPEFKVMNEQIIKNSKTLAKYLIDYGYSLATSWTDNHLILMKVWKWRGAFMQDALDIAGITLNKNTVPSESCSPFNPSWIRMWTPIMTMRGMKEEEMKQVASWINRVSEIVKGFDYSPDKEERKKINSKFKEFIKNNQELKEIRVEVKGLCLKFPIYK